MKIKCEYCGHTITKPHFELSLYNTTYNLILYCDECHTEVYDNWTNILINKGRIDKTGYKDLIPHGEHCVELLDHEPVTTEDHWKSLLVKRRVARICPFREYLVLNSRKMDRDYIGGMYDPDTLIAHCTFTDHTSYNDSMFWDGFKCCKTNMTK
jgi:hypothetical protein